MSINTYFAKNSFGNSPTYDPGYKEVRCHPLLKAGAKLTTRAPIKLTQKTGFELDEAIRTNSGSKKELAEDAKAPRSLNDFYGKQLSENCVLSINKNNPKVSLTGNEVTIEPGARFEFSGTSRLWKGRVFEQNVSIYKDDKFIAGGNILCNSLATISEIDTALSKLMPGNWLTSVWNDHCEKDELKKATEPPARAIGSEQK